MFKKTLLSGILISALLIGIETVAVQSTFAVGNSCPTCQLKSQLGSQLKSELNDQLSDNNIRIDRDTGVFVYTPDEGFGHNGRIDDFLVNADDLIDKHFHDHGEVPIPDSIK
jgi:hypothetical protein